MLWRLDVIAPITGSGPADKARATAVTNTNEETMTFRKKDSANMY